MFKKNNNFVLLILKFLYLVPSFPVFWISICIWCFFYNSFWEWNNFHSSFFFSFFFFYEFAKLAMLFFKMKIKTEEKACWRSTMLEIINRASLDVWAHVDWLLYFWWTACGARYKTRPGLQYHYNHFHNGMIEDETVPSPKPPARASSRTAGLYF